MINILQVIGGMGRGGAETFLMNVLRNIDRSKYNFVFLCYGDKPFDYEEEVISLGAKIVRVRDIKEVGFRQHVRDLRKVVVDNSIDVVHAHTYYNSVFSLIAAILSGVRLRIVHSHNTQSEPSPSLAKQFYFFVSKIGIEIFANKFVACGDDAGRALFVPWRKFQVINNGINIKDFAYSQDSRNSVREELGIDKRATVLMHAGRFAEVKNHDFLIDTFAEYQKYDPKSRLILVGDGPLRKKTEDKVEKLNLSNAVKFLGLRSDVYRIYSAADAFVFPSIFEGLPVVLVEAQTNGLRCLVSDSVDKDTKLTEAVEFYQLSKTASEWANRISSMNLARVDSQDTMLNSSYNIKISVKNIEKLYIDSRGCNL